MSDKPKIFTGLAVFVVVAAFPIWRSFGTPAATKAQPNLELPKESARCVEAKEYMRASHMDLLNRWRDAVVRDGQRVYTASSGERHDMSLSRTCMSMQCHSSREKFCQRCHEYSNVEPSCWQCHVTPEGS